MSSGSIPLSLSGSITQQNVTRANEQGFVTGDRMGIYVVDRVNGEAGILGASDNRAQNMIYTFDGNIYKWSSGTPIYWRDQQTPIDIYGYYPAVNFISSPTAYHFEVQRDQSTEAGNGDLCGYEKSDLLWGKAANVSFTTEQIIISYHHIMAGVRVQLVKGEGISDTEWEKLPKQVSIDNTVRSATVNLSDGSIEAGTGASPINMAPQSNDAYRAIVIPQTVAASKQLLSITLDGLTYGHTLETSMNYQSGCLHNFTMTINKREPSGDYEINVTNDGITPWVNDENSHQFSALAYVTVHCPQYGTLKQCIINAGYDYKTIQNLKVTGELTHSDLSLIRDEMTELHHLNLKEVKIKHICYKDTWDNFGSFVGLYCDDMMPRNMFYSQHTIRSLVLPSSLKVLGSNCFREMRLMYSTLEIPEGVTKIEDGALCYNDYNGVELILPNTLEYIGNSAFSNNGYKCELRLNDNIKYIGNSAFQETSNFHGVFCLPSKTQSIDDYTFWKMGSNGSFTGELEIPQGITEIGKVAFSDIAFKNRIELSFPAGIKTIGKSAFVRMRFKSLNFNDDMNAIENEAFYDCNIPFELQLPSQLQSIGTRAFHDCGIEGTLTIPENCLTIAEGAFELNDITKIVLPSKCEYISAKTFSNCPILKEIIIPKYVDVIEHHAFANCYALQTVTCLNPEPPSLGEESFGVYFDKCVLQVPEASVETYRHTDGWNQFQNITAYHELAFNVPEILCLDKGQTATGVIRAEGAWEVSECPDWVTVTPSSGTAAERKAELTITVNPLGNVTADREGRIVFRLTDKNYTTYTTVKQRYMGDIGEDKKVVLQSASAGAPRAIPIFIVGEGYDADDVVSGQYMEDMQQTMEHLFSCEPYKTYRNYFTVSTAIAVSPEHGINGRKRFEPENPWESTDNVVWQYAKAHGEGITDERAGQATIIVLYNSNYLGDNHSSLREDGRTISYLGKSTDTYPYEQRSFVLREVGGTAFGHLGVEGVNHFTFLKSCTCPGCSGMDSYNHAKRLGWYDNISISGKMSEVPWSHLIFDERYAQQVDIFEGAYNHARGVYRSENMSIMGSAFIPYFNTISRQSIVKRILEYSGEGYTFEKFIAKDKMEIPEE